MILSIYLSGSIETNVTIVPFASHVVRLCLIFVSSSEHTGEKQNNSTSSLALYLHMLNYLNDDDGEGGD